MDDDRLDPTLAAMSATLLEIVRMLGRVDERLGHLEVLLGPVALAEREPEWVDDMTPMSDEGRPWYSQSVQKRQWDESAQRWVYTPEP